MKKLMVIAGGLVLVGALAFAGVTYAQTPEPGTPGAGRMGVGGFGFGDGMQRGEQMMNGRHGQGGPLHDLRQDALAEALGLTREAFDSRIAAGETPREIAEAQGLTQEEFAQALADAHEAAVAEALAQGLITQGQADHMLERGFGRGFGLGRRGGPGGMGFAADGALRDLMHDAIADELGLTRADLDSRLAAGERLAEIAEAEGMSREELAQALTNAHDAAVAEALAQGLITQAQADRMLERGFGQGGRFFGPCAPGTPAPETESETGLSL